jgi:hypothetical protein
MFKKYLFAALLLAGSLTAQAAPPVTIMQSQLPFTILNPGTYVLATDLIFPAGFGGTFPFNTGAINISPEVPGPVVVDLKGHTISTADTSGLTSRIGIAIGSFNGTFTNANPITIRNGTLKNFSVGILAIGEDFTCANCMPQLTHITIDSIAFYILPEQVSIGPNRSEGILFGRVNSSNVKNCTFDRSETSSTGFTWITNGIDVAVGFSAGNSFDNNTFFNTLIPINVLTGGDDAPFGDPRGTLVIDHYSDSPLKQSKP